MVDLHFSQVVGPQFSEVGLTHSVCRGLEIGYHFAEFSYVSQFFFKSSLILLQKCPFSDFISMAIVILMSARMTVMLVFMSTALPLCLCQKQLTVIYWIHLMGHRDNHPTRRFLQAKEHKKCSFGWIRDAAFCPAVIWSVIPVWTGYKNIWW